MGIGRKLCAWHNQILNTSILNKQAKMPTFHSIQLDAMLYYNILVYFAVETEFYEPAF